MRDTDQAEFDDLDISIPPMDDDDNGQTDNVTEHSTHDGDTGTLYMGDSLIDD